jgi:hypothetical protein
MFSVSNIMTRLRALCNYGIPWDAAQVNLRFPSSSSVEDSEFVNMILAVLSVTVSGSTSFL